MLSLVEGDVLELIEIDSLVLIDIDTESLIDSDGLSGCGFTGEPLFEVEELIHWCLRMLRHLLTH